MGGAEGRRGWRGATKSEWGGVVVLSDRCTEILSAREPTHNMLNQSAVFHSNCLASSLAAIPRHFGAIIASSKLYNLRLSFEEHSSINGMKINPSCLGRRRLFLAVY